MSKIDSIRNEIDMVKKLIIVCDEEAEKYRQEYYKTKNESLKQKVQDIHYGVRDELRIQQGRLEKKIWEIERCQK